MKTGYSFKVETEYLGDVLYPQVALMTSNLGVLTMHTFFRSIREAVSLHTKDKILFLNTKWAAIFTACSSFPLTGC